MLLCILWVFKMNWIIENPAKCEVRSAIWFLNGHILKLARQSSPRMPNTHHGQHAVFDHHPYRLLAIFSISISQKSYWSESNELQAALSDDSWVLWGNLKACSQINKSLNVGVIMWKSKVRFTYVREINYLRKKLL